MPTFTYVYLMKPAQCLRFLCTFTSCSRARKHGLKFEQSVRPPNPRPQKLASRRSDLLAGWVQACGVKILQQVSGDKELEERVVRCIPFRVA